MDAAAFDQLVRDALDDLPEWVEPYLADIAIQVVDHPPSGEDDLYGLYEGPNLGDDPVGHLPPEISIFRVPLARDFGHDPRRLAEQVRITVLHEVAHRFGIPDERLEELGYG